MSTLHAFVVQLGSLVSIPVWLNEVFEAVLSTIFTGTSDFRVYTTDFRGFFRGVVNMNEVYVLRLGKFADMGCVMDNTGAVVIPVQSNE